MKYLFITAFLIFTTTNFFSQTPIIRTLQYNLLYYGLDDYGCTSSNNNVADKTNYLKTLISEYEPDIFSVNEINASTNIHDYLLANVFTYNGYNSYHRGSVKGSYLTSQVFYNGITIKLKSENEIYANPRNIFEYKFYYNSPDLANGDTVYFSYFVAHLKAGDDATDEDKRADATYNLMNYINSKQIDNFILAGDLNLYSSNEDAYSYLIDNSNFDYYFDDPGIAGNWHENESYADYHTQSTFYSSNGCSVAGGLDDRFDFILFSQAIENGTNDMNYVNNSFSTLGQDGNHFNSSVSWQGNSSVSSDILEVLENCSDHLPILAEFSINQTIAETDELSHAPEKPFSLINNKNILQISSSNKSIDYFDVYIYDISGKIIMLQSNKVSKTAIDLNALNKGLYLVKITTIDNISQTEKVIIY